jgi:hypothetical protein
LGTLFFSFSKRKEKCGKKKLEEKFGRNGRNSPLSFPYFHIVCCESKTKMRIAENETTGQIFKFV